jgi:succinate dehydrogenase hydrophobic anchor subunit
LDVTLREASRFAIGYDALLLAVVTVGFQRGVRKQTTSLLLGLLCGNVVSMVLHQRSQSIVLADQRYQDLWWLTLLLTRAAAVLYHYVRPSLKKGWRL